VFRLDTDGTTILMHRGNTGVLKINLSGYTFGNDDRVLFMMKSQSGTEVKSKICQDVFRFTLQTQIEQQETPRRTGRLA